MLPMRIVSTLLCAALVCLGAGCNEKDTDTRPLCGEGQSCPPRYQCDTAANRCDFKGGPLPDAAIPDSRPPGDARPVDAAGTDAAQASPDAAEATPDAPEATPDAG
jgi:hypothetical protein